MTYQLRTPIGYTPVPMHKLDYARNVLKNRLSEFNANHNTYYSCKAFYIGPRINTSISRRNAVWAKLAIYYKKQLIGYV